MLAPVWAVEFAVIGHPQGPLVALNDKQVKRIFLGRQRSFDDGSSIDLAWQTGETGDVVLKSLTGKSASMVSAVWSGLLFSGEAKMPADLKSDAEVINWIKTDVYGVGYIHKKSVTPQTRVLFVIDVDLE